MRNNRRRVLLAVAICAALSAQAISSSGNVVVSPASAAMQPGEMQFDFDLMRKALEEAHGGLYRYSSKADMDRMFDAERAKLNRLMPKIEFLAVLIETLVQIRCGHTGLTPDEETQKEVAAAPKFPLRMAIEDRKFIVQANETAGDKTMRPGMEILEINGHKPGELLALLLPKLTADGDIETGKLYRLQRNFELLYWAFVDRATEFTIKVRDNDGKTITSTLSGVLDSDRSKNQKQNAANAEFQTAAAKLKWWSENLGLRFLKDPEVAEIRIDGFGGSNYPKWMEDTFGALREKGTKALIIDLRGNGGGADMYGAMLVSYLTDKPFRYFDHIDVKTISPSFKEYSDWRVDREPQLKEAMTPNPAGGYLVPTKLHPGVGEQQPGKYPFIGKVFVLIDGGTFSTAADFCAVTHHLKRATFIGEETGGGYYGNNSGMQTILTLPNSKARIRVPMYEYWNAVPGYDGKRRGTRPDHVVQTRVANVLRGVDEQVELAIKLAK